MLAIFISDTEVNNMEEGMPISDPRSTELPIANRSTCEPDRTPTQLQSEAVLLQTQQRSAYRDAQQVREDSSREEGVLNQDLDDSLGEEDFSQTQMPQEPLKFQNLSNNNCDDKFYHKSFSKDENLQICASPDEVRSFLRNSTPVQFDDNVSTQQSPSVLTNLQPSLQAVNLHKMKPIFGKKSKSHSFPKILVTKNTSSGTDNDNENNLSPTNDKPIKASASGGRKAKEKPTKTNASKTKKVTLIKSTEEPESGGKPKEKPTKMNASKKMALPKSIEDKDKPKKTVSLTAEEKAIKKQEQEARKRDKEQKRIERERKKEENERLKAEKKLKSQLLKDKHDQKKAELEHKKREDKFLKGEIKLDKGEKKEHTLTSQRKEEQKKASVQKTASLKQLDVNGVLEVNPISISKEPPEEEVDSDVSGMHDLECQDPAEAATNISNPASPQSVLSSVSSEGIGSPTHNPHLEPRSSFLYDDNVPSVTSNLKQPLPEDAQSDTPMPKRAKKMDTKSLRASSELKSSAVSSDPKERNAMTKSDPGIRPLQKKPRTKVHTKANMTGPVWVRCCNKWCQKWRQLRDHFDPLTVPTFWNCTDNSDTDYNDCSVPMEQWADYENDEFQFVESAYVPGSLVWAKLESYPWYYMRITTAIADSLNWLFQLIFLFFRWPAMVEADPDMDCYYEMTPANSLVPVCV